MRDVAFCTDTFASPATHAYSERVLGCLLWALIYANESWMLGGHTVPPLYQSGVRWAAERPLGQSACRGGNGQERFLGVRQVLADGEADCEDVACWRVAELRTGIVRPQFGRPPKAGHPPVTIVPPPFPMSPKFNACPAFFHRDLSPKQKLYHIVVAWLGPRGVVFEDPSRVLGMGENRPEWG